MARDHLKKHKVTLTERRLVGGRWQDAGTQVEVYGDDADRLERLHAVEAKSQKKS